MVDFTDVRTDRGATRYSFDVTVAGERVPAVIWTPEGAKGPRPLVLMGHGGSQHKKIEGLRIRAEQYARRLGYATLAIDAPGHGDRVSREESARNMAETGARVTGQVRAEWTPERLARMAERTRQAVPEWNAALDVAQTFDFVGSGGPVGYWGVSMGTAIGVPFVAQQPRIACAVLGLAGLRPGAPEMAEAAAKITIPVEFVFQWDDAVAPREHGIALFDAFGSKEKTMHINPGGHMDIPPFEGASWERFFARHLGIAADAPAARKVAEPA
jgi:pimeloyl-ACP methyl ester carboxylesterase